MNHYYKILGVAPSADLQAIKKAFRKKAKKYHPDVSTHPNAEDLFIELNEAYEYIVAVKEGRIRPQSRANGRRNSRSSGTSDQKESDKWDRYRNSTGRGRDPGYRWDEEKEKARKRARDHARMKYEAYKKTEAYQWSNSGLVFFTWLYTYLPVFIYLFVLVPIVFDFGGWPILVVSTILYSPLFLVTVRGRVNLKDEDVWGSFVLLFKTKRTYKYLTLVLNFWFLVFYTLRTTVNHTISIVAFVLIAVTVYFIRERFDKQFLSLRFILAGMAPLLVNFFFAVNFWFSSPSSREHEYLKHFVPREGWFVNDRYDNNLFVHMFLVPDYGWAIIETEKGVFGMEVVTDFYSDPSEISGSE